MDVPSIHLDDCLWVCNSMNMSFLLWRPGSKCWYICVRHTERSWKSSDSQLATTSGLFEEEAHLTVFADSTGDSLTEVKSRTHIWNHLTSPVCALPSISDIFPNPLTCWRQWAFYDMKRLSTGHKLFTNCFWHCASHTWAVAGYKSMHCNQCLWTVSLHLAVKNLCTGHTSIRLKR